MDNTQIIGAILVIGLVIVVFGLDWADRRRHDQMMARNQKTMELLNDFITNPEINRIVTGIRDDTPVGLTFVAPEPEPDPHIWELNFICIAVTAMGDHWPTYNVEKWERNEIGETRYIESRTYMPPPAIDMTTPTISSGGTSSVKARSAAAEENLGHS